MLVFIQVQVQFLALGVVQRGKKLDIFVCTLVHFEINSGGDDFLVVIGLVVDQIKLECLLLDQLGIENRFLVPIEMESGLEAVARQVEKLLRLVLVAVYCESSTLITVVVVDHHRSEFLDIELCREFDDIDAVQTRHRRIEESYDSFHFSLVFKIEIGDVILQVNNDVGQKC